MSYELLKNEIETICGKLVELFILSIIGALIGFSFCKYNECADTIGYKFWRFCQFFDCTDYPGDSMPHI